MSKRKIFCYVGVQTESGIVFVTSINNTNRMCFWNLKEKPKVFTYATAKELAEGLCMNLITAFVVESFFELECQPISEKEGE